MNGVSLSDLGLLIPELILIGVALAVLLTPSRRVASHFCQFVLAERTESPVNVEFSTGSADAYRLWDAAI